MTAEDYRKRYADALRGLTYDNASVSEVNAAVAVRVGEDATPAAYVEAIEGLAMFCRRCGGTGRFVTMILNGCPTGPGGPCYRCNGKASQTAADGHRNRVHDLHQLDRMVL